MKILSYEECKKELSEVLTYRIDDIIINEEDINQLTSNKDILVMATDEGNDANSAIEAMKSIVLEFEENELFIEEADSILVYFQINSSYNIMNIGEAMNIIHDKLDAKYVTKNPYVFFGTSRNDSFKCNDVKVTVFIGYYSKRA